MKPTRLAPACFPAKVNGMLSSNGALLCMAVMLIMAFAGFSSAFAQGISSDLDGDKDIDGKDLALFIDAYVNSLPRADLNKDMLIDASDLAKFGAVIGYVNTWSGPQQFFQLSDFYDGMVRDADGIWHFIFRVDENNRLTLRYTNTHPDAEVSILVDLPQCDAGGCQPGQVEDLFGSLAIGPDDRLHVVYNAGADIFYLHQPVPDTWSQPQPILSNNYIYDFTVDVVGNWHLLYASGLQTYYIHYTSSASLPSSDLLVEYRICQDNTDLCGQPGYIFDINGKAMAAGPDGTVYVAIGIEPDSSMSNDKILMMSKTPEGVWSSPQEILHEPEGGRVTAITTDSLGHWHLVYRFYPFLSQTGFPSGWGIKYTNSLKSPQSEILVEYEHRYSPDPFPGLVTDLSGETIAVDANGDIHLGYGLRMEDTVQIMQMVKSD